MGMDFVPLCTLESGRCVCNGYSQRFLMGCRELACFSCGWLPAWFSFIKDSSGWERIRSNQGQGR